MARPGETLTFRCETTNLVGAFLDAARGLQAYQGIKIQTPADATVERRLAMITSIHDVMATA